MYICICPVSIQSPQSSQYPQCSLTLPLVFSLYKSAEWSHREVLSWDFGEIYLYHTWWDKKWEKYPTTFISTYFYYWDTMYLLQNTVQIRVVAKSLYRPKIPLLKRGTNYQFQANILPQYIPFAILTSHSYKPSK